MSCQILSSNDVEIDYQILTFKLKLLKNMRFLEKYYPILLAFLSFLYSIYLWFSGQQLEGLYVGLWPITILGFAIALRQRRKDDLKRKQ